MKSLKYHEKMPPNYRINLRYPHLPTMLASDPSEAVHAELQMDVVRRHFDLKEHARLGGGVAHTLLLNNRALHRDQHTPAGRAVLEMIMQADEAALDQVSDGNLFTFFVARPKAPARSPEQLLAWRKEEEERELAAAARGGRYYEPTLLELIYNDVAWQLYQSETRARSEIDAIRNSTSWRVTKPLRSLRTILRAHRG